MAKSTALSELIWMKDLSPTRRVERARSSSRGHVVLRRVVHSIGHDVIRQPKQRLFEYLRGHHALGKQRYGMQICLSTRFFDVHGSCHPINRLDFPERAVGAR